MSYLEGRQQKLYKDSSERKEDAMAMGCVALNFLAGTIILKAAVPDGVKTLKNDVDNKDPTVQDVIEANEKIRLFWSAVSGLWLASAVDKMGDQNVTATNKQVMGTVGLRAYLVTFDDKTRSFRELLKLWDTTGGWAKYYKPRSS